MSKRRGTGFRAVLLLVTSGSAHDRTVWLPFLHEVGISSIVLAPESPAHAQEEVGQNQSDDDARIEIDRAVFRNGKGDDARLESCDLTIFLVDDLIAQSNLCLKISDARFKRSGPCEHLVVEELLAGEPHASAFPDLHSPAAVRDGLPDGQTLHVVIAPAVFGHYARDAFVHVLCGSRSSRKKCAKRGRKVQILHGCPLKCERRPVRLPPGHESSIEKPPLRRGLFMRRWIR